MNMERPRATTVILSLLLASAVLHAQVTNSDLRSTGGTVNARIVEFVKSKQGKKVGHGECWDLAAEALTAAGATWDGQYTWGLEIDPLKDSVLPGDVIQFENVIFEWEEGNAVNRETMPHHTAVIVEVKAPGVFVIAHQNYGPIGRKVGTSDLVLARKTKGKLLVYRPQGG
jgi:hypothetical protein